MANFSKRAFDTLIPLGILTASIVTFVAFGKVEPKRRAAAGNSLGERMKALPGAEVSLCRDFAELDHVLDIKANGQVVPYREIQQAAEVGGRIVYKSKNCEAGSFVTKGELLLKIDATDYQLELERQEKLQQQERQAIQELDQELVNTENLLKLTREELVLREREIERFNKLAGGFASETEFDRAKSSRLQTLNQVAQLENQVKLLGKRRSRLESSELLAQTQFRRASEDLKRTEIHAATSGVVVRENVELDSFVQRGSIVVTLEETQRIEVAIDLRMDQLYWILNQASKSTSRSEPAPSLPLDEPRDPPENMSGATSESKLYALPETPVTIIYRLSGRDNQVYSWQGRLERYDGIGLTPQTRMVPVRIVVDRPQHAKDGSSAEGGGPSALMRGMFVEAIIHTRPKTPMVLVPNLGLRPGGRIWKFVADATVLDRSTQEHAPNSPPGESLTLAKNPAKETKDSTIGESMKDQEQSAGEEFEEVFDLTKWQAGRMELIEGARAIADVVLPSADLSSNSDPLKKNQQYWICEIPQGTLAAGDAVVTTPLAGIESGSAEFVRVPSTVQP